MLIDQAKIYVFGGRGGKGCQSMCKDIFHRKGVPDGGDGGNGGSVIVRSDPNLGTLLDFRYNQHHRAGKGTHGGSNKKIGKSGDDRVLLVPVGTIVKDLDTDLIIRDLDSENVSVVVAKGGAGGKGSAKLRVATEGDEGEIRTLLFELKLVADAGLIGFPNAGKSTLLSKISKAQTKIAPYPFTTRSPKLGVVEVSDNTFVAADMPGLIEGAHEGKGLGDRFLRHIERTRVLVHVVDIVPLDGADPVENFRKLEKELELYNAEVYSKPRVIAVNKMDMPGAEENLKRFSSEIRRDVWPISAIKGEGLGDLTRTIYGEIKNVREKDEENNGQDRNQSTYGPE
ncbi:MAG: GTPase ObgE [Candidatus Tantalella remota]|nr:GTPase ObgE [Candidatus Tantalella remota]